MDFKDESASASSESVGDARGGHKQDGLLHLSDRHHQGRAGQAGQAGGQIKDPVLQVDN